MSIPGIKNQNDTFKYNSTILYKNNMPVNIDIDSICEDLYKNAHSKEIFNEIMAGVEKDVMSSDIIKKDQSYLPSTPSSQYNQNYGNYGYNNSIKNTNKYSFKSTIPEGELISPTPYHQKILHKKYTDVNANSKYYYPNESTMGNEINKSQWTNRANRIVLDSQNNYSTMRGNGIGNFSMMSSINHNNTQLMNSGNAFPISNTTNPYTTGGARVKTSGTYGI